MAKSTKPTATPTPPGDAQQGVVTTAERRKTKAGDPMLILTIGEERVSFFEAEDVYQPVAAGDTVTFTMTRKGNYLNGKGLAVLPKAPTQPQPAAQPQAKPAVQGPPQSQPKPVSKPAPVAAKTVPGTRAILHSQSSEELEHLYQEEAAGAKVEPARLGQISNQVRYARIEELLREILALLQKSYLDNKG